MRSVFRDCLLVGIPVSLLGMLLAAAALCVIDLPLQFYTAAAALPLLCGCFCAGFSAGRRARHGGIRCGISAALLLTLFWYTFICIRTGHLYMPMLLTIAIPCGMCGGVLGVNTALPMPHQRMHTGIALRERLTLRPMLLHKPKKNYANEEQEKTSRKDGC